MKSIDVTFKSSDEESNYKSLLFRNDKALDVISSYTDLYGLDVIFYRNESTTLHPQKDSCIHLFETDTEDGIYPIEDYLQDYILVVKDRKYFMHINSHEFSVCNEEGKLIAYAKESKEHVLLARVKEEYILPAFISLLYYDRYAKKDSASTLRGKGAILCEPRVPDKKSIRAFLFTQTR